MMFKFTILETLLKNTFRIFKGENLKGMAHYAKQYHGGGDDYHPPTNTKCLATTIHNNRAETVVYLYQDGTARIAQPGEKRIYATNPENTELTASIHLKNTGEITIEAKTTININSGTINATGTTTINGDCTINGNCTVSGECSLGGGGSPVLLESTTILDSGGKPCSIVNPATKVKGS